MAPWSAVHQYGAIYKKKYRNTKCKTNANLFLAELQMTEAVLQCPLGFHGRAESREGRNKVIQVLEPTM